MDENLILFVNDIREGLFGIEKQIFSKRVGDSSSKGVNTEGGKFVQPLNEKDEADDDEQPLRWSVQKQKGSKGKEKVVDAGAKVSRTCSTRGSKKNLLEDAMKSSESSIPKKRRLEKVIVVKDKNVKVVDIGESEDVDPDVVSTTKKRRKDIYVEGRTRSSTLISEIPTGIKQNTL